MEFCNFLDEMVANGAILLEFSFNYVFHFLGVCEIIKILIGNYAFLIRDVLKKGSSSWMINNIPGGLSSGKAIRDGDLE